MKLLKTKKMLVVSIAVISLLSFGIAMANTAKVVKQKAVISDAVKTKAIVKPHLVCDLEVTHISAGQCFCNDSLSNVGAMLYKDMWVRVGNFLCSGKGANVNALLDVQYFDLMAHHLVTTTIPVTIDKNRSKMVKVKTGFLLIKQTPGIKAEIRFGTNGIITDCNGANNRKIQRQCQLRIVQ